MRRKWRHRKKRNFIRHKRFSPDDITDHHRKPRKLGGKYNPGNIIRVRRNRHEAWHTLFDSLDAPWLFDKLLNYWYSFGESISRHNTIYGRINRKKIAWMTLFGYTKPSEIADLINEVWMDPAFKIRTNGKGLAGARLISVQHNLTIRSDIEIYKIRSQAMLNAA